MRAREPDADGFVDRGPVKLHWERFGDGEPTVLFVPAWAIVHSRAWKMQVAYFARHFRGLRVHQTRLQGGDASSDSYCHTR